MIYIIEKQAWYDQAYTPYDWWTSQRCNKHEIKGPRRRRAKAIVWWTLTAKRSIRILGGLLSDLVSMRSKGAQVLDSLRE